MYDDNSECMTVVLVDMPSRMITNLARVQIFPLHENSECVTSVHIQHEKLRIKDAHDIIKKELHRRFAMY